MLLRLFAIGTVTLAGISVSSRGQTARQPARGPQAFEVAMFRLEDPHSTVDYNRPDAPSQNQAFPSNRLTMFHTMLKSLIAEAWGVRYQYILGGPEWLNSQ